MLACLSPNGLNRFDGSEAPDRLVVATENGISVLERGPRGGAWRVGATALPDVHATTLTTLPGQTGLVLGTHGDGVFFSADGGASWEPRGDGLTIADVYTVAAAKTADGIVLYAGTQPASLFESRDLGKSWKELPALKSVPGTELWTFPAPPRIAHTKMLVFDPRDPRRFYAAIEQGAVLKTTDGGRTFRELDDYSKPDDRAYRDIHQLMLVPSNPATMYMTTGVGFYRSGDAGETWQRLTDEAFRIGYPDHLALSPDERTIFMSGARGHPGVWRQSHVADTAIVRSNDGGKSWEPCEHGFAVLPRANIEAMTLAAYPGGYTLFVGDTDGAVHASEDQGATWTRIVDGVGPMTKGDHAALLHGRRIEHRAHA